MPRVCYAVYMLAGSGRQPPHPSAGKLTTAEAAAQGALYPIPGTIAYEWVPDPVVQPPMKNRPEAFRPGAQGQP